MLILASESPRRRELLSLLTADFSVCPAHVQERLNPAHSPSEAVLALATQKARCVADSHPDACVIAADTLVALDGKILGKPRDEADAAAMLHLLSGRVHRVYTGVALFKPGYAPVSFYEETQVEFFPLEESLIAYYVGTGEPMDKAGAYGIQGRGTVLVRRIEGDYNNVVGLPLAKLYRVLLEIGEL